MSKVFARIKKFIFAKRQIIYITDAGIKSKNLNSLFIILNILLVGWVSFTTVKYFELNRKILNTTYNNKEQNEYIEKITVLQQDLNNIKSFISSLNKYDRLSAIDFKSLDKNTINNNNNIHLDAKLVLSRAKQDLKKINNSIIERINNLSKTSESVGLDPNIKTVSYEKEIRNVEYKDLEQDTKESVVLSKTLKNNLHNLMNLEDFINTVPFAEPMDVLYISSEYGARNDPINGRKATHHGLDMVGGYLANIYATAPGKVIFAGRNGGYGKSVVIEHKNNFKTLYAHLNSYNVKVGDIVKRGDIIGVQGNTGKSTGHHLHYEIFKNDKRFNPKEFIKVGANYY